MVKKKRPGRPTVPKAERRTGSIRVAVTEREKKEIEKAAKDAGLSISDYGRIKLIGGEK